MTGAVTGADEVAPLLSSVSVMLAAFGVFYTAQREGIEAAIADRSLPNGADATREVLRGVNRHRNVAAGLGIAALAIWLLLLPEIVERAEDAFASGFDLGDYSTPDAIFFVAANAWLLLAFYVGARWWALRTRSQKLKNHLGGLPK
jgi:hypothetical protein